MDTSRELTGSSHISSFGPQHHGARDADALALAAAELVRIAMRSCGAARPTRSSIASIRARRARAASERSKILQRLGQRLAHGHARIEARQRILKYDLQVAALPAQGRGVAGQEIPPRHMTVPRAPESAAGCARASVDLPDPDSPTSATVSPRAQIEAHVLERRRTRRSRRRWTAHLEQHLARGSFTGSSG